MSYPEKNQWVDRNIDETLEFRTHENHGITNIKGIVAAMKAKGMATRS